jgi:hypothetical protein
VKATKLIVIAPILGNCCPKKLRPAGIDWLPEGTVLFNKLAYDSMSATNK